MLKTATGHEKTLYALTFLSATGIVGALLYYGTPLFPVLQDSLPGNGTWVGTTLALLGLAALSLALVAGVLLIARSGVFSRLPRLGYLQFTGVVAALLFGTLLLNGLQP